MVLAMSRPWKHPKTGMYYLRKRVPADLLSKVGYQIVKITLKTKDPRIAKDRFMHSLNQLELQWANLRLGEQQLSEREAHALAENTYSLWVLSLREEPSRQRFWRTDLYDRLWSMPEIHKDIANIRKFGAKEFLDSFVASEMRRFSRKFSADILNTKSMTIDGVSRDKLDRAMAAALQRGSEALKRFSAGYDQDKELDRLMAIQAAQARTKQKPSHFDPESKSNSIVSISKIFDKWWIENKAAGLKPSTYHSYKNTIMRFQKFIGHDDAIEVTVKNVLDFKDFRLGEVSAKTVKDSDLSALKAIFGWAQINRIIPTNPATGITIKLGKTPKLRAKGFTEDEAIAILASSLSYENAHEYAGTSSAKRWVPWLCAFTGARVGEIAQIRRQDVRQVGDYYIIRITPEAGTVKTNEAREIVLHPQLVQIGFPTFVRSCPEGHLFIRPSQNGDVLGPLRGLKNRLAEFARAIVSDRNVAPNHGWRHRFKTVGMECGVSPRILDAIQGHSAKSVADTYGDVTLKTIAAAINRLPYITLDVINSPSHTIDGFDIQRSG